MQNLISKAIKGFSWTFADGLFSQATNILLLYSLINYVNPDEFGLFAIAFVIASLSETLIDSGLTSALVQAKNTSLTDESTVFHFNLGLGTLLSTTLWLFSSQIAAFYKRPELASILCAMSLAILMNASAMVQKSILSKAMMFKCQAVGSIVAMTSAAITAISMAVSGYGVWALVGMHLTRSFLQTSIYWYSTPWRPQFSFNPKALRKLLRFGGGMLLSSLTSQASQSIYTAVIGRIFSVAELGLFSKAGDITLSPCRAISSSLTRVAFPYFSIIQSDQEELVKSIRNALKVTAMVSFPIAAGIASTAEGFVSAFLPYNWHNTIPLIQILCIPAAFYPIHDIHLNALKAAGRSDLFFRIELFKQTSSILILVATISFGLTALAVGQAAGTLVNILANSFYSTKLLRYSYARQAIDLLPFIVSSITMGLAVAAVSVLQMAPAILLATQILIGATTYLVLLTTVCRPQIEWPSRNQKPI